MRSHANINNLLQVHPELVADVANFVGVEVATAEGWREGKSSLGGITAVLQKEYLRRHDTVYAPEPVDDIRQSMINGLADKVFTAEELSDGGGYINPSQLAEFLCGRTGEARGFFLLKTKSYLTDKNVLSDEWKRQYRQEVLWLIAAYVDGKTIEEMASQLQVPEHRLKSWIFGYCSPPPNKLKAITKIFKPPTTTTSSPRTDTRPRLEDVTPADSLELIGQAIVLAAKQIQLLGDRYLACSTEEQRRQLRDKYPGVFMRSGNVLANLSSETTYQRNFKPREGK